MRLRLLTIALFYLHIVSAQNADSVQNVLNRILPVFKYKQELKNCLFMPGGNFIAGRRNGADSVTLGGPIEMNIQPFLFSKFEVRNKEYKKFVHYTRDSILHTLLDHFIINDNTRQIDWNAEIDWKDKRLEPIFISPEERIFGRKEIDANKIIYKTSSGKEIAVYPDTLVWIRDFSYSYNEPMTKRYFNHPAFGNYPVLGVSQVQASAYCDWKTSQWNNSLTSMNEKEFRFIVRLPSSEEWEYGAGATEPLSVFDSTQTKSYKFGLFGSERASNQGYKYNFGKYFNETSFEVKSYIHDGFFYTAPANTYRPDKYGLYNLIGNVAEWTSSFGSYQPVYDNTGKNEELSVLRKKFPSSPFNGMNEQEIDAYLKKHAIVKGGAWNTDDAFYLQPGSNQYFLPDSSATHCYIGFRVAIELVLKRN